MQSLLNFPIHLSSRLRKIPILGFLILNHFCRLLFIFIIANLGLEAKTHKALLLGFNDYSKNSKFPSLRYAENDAQVLEKILTPAFQVKNLSQNVNITKKEFLDFLRDYSNELDEKEIFFFFFSGHGLDDKIVLPVGEEVSVHEILQALKKVSNYLLVFDACREKEKISNDKKLYFHPNLNVQKLSGGNSRAVFFSTGKGQFSREDESLGHGVFSYHLIEEVKAHFKDKESMELDVELLIARVKHRNSVYNYEKCLAPHCKPFLPESVTSINGRFLLHEKKPEPDWRNYLVPGLWQYKQKENWKIYSLGVLGLFTSILVIDNYRGYQREKNDFQIHKRNLYLNSIGQIDALDLYLLQSASSSKRGMDGSIQNMTDLSLGFLGFTYLLNAMDLFFVPAMGDFSLKVYTFSEKREGEVYGNISISFYKNL